MAYERIEVDDLAPIRFPVQDDGEPAVELAGLRESQQLGQFVQGPEAAGERHEAASEMREPEFAHEEVVELERQLAGDVGIRVLLVGQADVEPHGSPASVRGPSVGGLHDSATSAGADDIAMATRGLRLRPKSNDPGELTRIGVVPPQGALCSQSRGSKEHDRVLDVLRPKLPQGCEIFRDDA